MASNWAYDQGSPGVVRQTGPSVAVEAVANAAMTAPSPPLLSQDTRFLLSPMPASMAQGQNLGQGQSKTTASSSTTVTLYPLEAVPSHLLCAICTLPYENPVHFLPCCHVFCLECIQLWIVMNLGDELLQNELRRAYPADEERQWILDVMEGQGGQHPHLQQQFMVELARMGYSRSRSVTGASGNNNFYESFSHFSPAQQQLLQQQQIQQRIASLLESRVMPKCPMCRTSLHIHGWDRIEEQVKVPTPTRPRPVSQSDGTTMTTLSFSDWMRGSSQGQGERPVSGVERRRRHDRFTANRGARGGSRGGSREDVIGEEEDEEIEMEHVQTSRSRLNHSNAMSPFPSGSSGSSFAARHQHRLEARQQDTSDMNDDEEIQSPTTAVIGRRPSEWMRYQQRQLQAHQEREQANRQRAAAAAAAGEEAGDIPHHPAITASRLNEQQEQIRRLYLEQESQEELLRTLTARAASIIEAEEENRRQVTNSNTTSFSTSDSSGRRGSLLSRHEQQQELAPVDRQSTSLEQSGDRQEYVGRESLEPEQDPRRVLARQSTLQIDTTITRPSSRQSQTSQNASTTRSRQTSYETESRPEQAANPPSIQQSEDDQGSQDSTTHRQGPQDMTEEEQQPLGSNVDNSMLSAMQQGTLAWAERHSSLRLDLGRQDEPLILSTGDDDEGDMSASDSVSDSTMSSASSDIQLSPSNESTLSYGTTSTFSHSIMNQTSVGTPFSQRSSTHPNWDQHSLSLQMPTIETEDTGVDVSHRRTLDSLVEGEREEFDEQPWSDHQREGEDEESHASYRKEHEGLGCGEFSGSTLDLEMSRAESKSRAEGPVDNIVEGDSRPSSSSSQTTGETNALNTVGQDTRTEGQTVDTQATSSPPDTVQDRDLTGTSSGYGFQFSQSVWTSRSSGASPLVRELDIHCPIITAEGSVTTIANMQIDADILARARSNSVLLSDDDLPNVRDRPSPIDSPIPTPSTARPRQRFPAGFPLLDDEGQPEEEDDEEEEEEVVVAVIEEEEEREATRHELDEAREEHPDPAAHVTESVISPVEPEVVEAQVTSVSTPQFTSSIGTDVVDEAQSDSAVVAIASPPSSQPAVMPESIQDPLSAAIAGDSTPALSLPVDVPSADIESAVDSADQDQPVTTPSIGPLRESLNSPPPLPLPLAAAAAAAVQGQEVVASEPSTRDVSTLERDSTLDEESSLYIRPSGVSDIHSSGDQGLLGAAAEPRPSRSTEEIEQEPEPEAATQLRTVVRYQPRLPKAHVMSDLISQIRVECPNKQFGCAETMEMQKTLQHGRDLCQFRMVMCPRTRCGLWMRADQILEHILMVEPSNSLASSSSSSLSTPFSSDGPSSARSAPSSSGRSHKV